MDDKGPVEELITALKEGVPPPIEVAAQFSKVVDSSARESAFNALIDMLYDTNPWLRARAIRALGHLGDHRAVGHLIETINDDDEIVGGEMIEARFEVLSAFKDPCAIRPLIGQLHRVDFKQAWDLYSFGDDAIAPMINALTHSNSYTRWQAAYWLGNKRDNSAVTALIDVTEDKNERVRLQGITSLGWIGSSEAIRFLKGLLKNPNLQIRNAAEDALHKATNKD